jgi:hypothetical protein
MGRIAPSQKATHKGGRDDVSTFNCLKEQDADPAYVQGDCRFRLKVEPGDGFSDGQLYMFYNAKPVAWGFGFGCFAGTNQEEVDARLDIFRQDGKIHSTMSPPVPYEPRQHFRMWNFSGANWTGTVTEYDTLYGMPDINFRRMRFCLQQTNGIQVICGEHQGPSPARARSSLTTYSYESRQILKILKTLVFVESPTN